MVALSLTKVAENQKLLDEARDFNNFAQADRFTQSKQRRFVDQLNQQLEKRRPQTLKNAGSELAEQTLNLDQTGITFKSPEAKSQLKNLFNIAASFFTNRNKLASSKESQRLVAGKIFQIGEGIATKIEEARQGSLSLFNKIKNFVNRHADRRIDEVRNLFDLDRYNASKRRREFTAQLQNPALDYGEFFPFTQVKAEHFKLAVDTVINRANTIYEDLLKLEEESRFKPEILTFDNTLGQLIKIKSIISHTVDPLECVTKQLGRDELDEAWEITKKKIEKFHGKTSTDKNLYLLVKRYADHNAEAGKLNQEQRRYLKLTLEAFETGGAKLTSKRREEFINNKVELAVLEEIGRAHV